MKETPVYYKKLKKILGNCEEGEWVYNDTANLCYVTIEKDGYRNLHYYAMEFFPPNDTIVYPLTLTTKLIADKMTELRNKYYKNKIMNADISHELEDAFVTLMNVDEENYDDAYDAIWHYL